MSFLEDNLENLRKGFEGEEEVRKFFRSKGIKHMQVDLIFKYDGKYCLAEVKSQEKFLAPPFDGHGLPQWQIDDRVKFYNSTGIEPFLIVKDPHDECLYIQSIIKLLEGSKFSTKGSKPRVIFHIDSFKKIPL